MDDQGRRYLTDLAKRLISEDPPAYDRALMRWMDHDARYLDDPVVAKEYLGNLRELHELASSPGPLPWLTPGEQGAIARATGELLQAYPPPPEAFQQTGLLPELVALLAQKLGIFRRRYLAFVETLDPTGRYHPQYMNFGPTGMCNLRCADCILWGALFTGQARGKLPLEGVLAHLADAERVGVHGLSMCIGEPTYDVPYMERVLERIRESSSLYLRSFITNGLFGRSRERSIDVWSRILAALGPEKTKRCLFAISSNPELIRQGVAREHTVQAVQTFLEVMPNDLVIVQMIRDEGYLELQRELLEIMVGVGLVAPESTEGSGERLVRTVPTTNGRTVYFSVMAKMPAIASPDGEREYDPYVFYLDPDALSRAEFPGLFMPVVRKPDPDIGEEDRERISLGPDGLFYVDYHFMVRRVRPLGETLPEALESFRKDPLLTLLSQEGGLNRVLDAYQSMPADMRPIHDLVRLVGEYSTVSMVAANVIFGDEDIALRLARWLGRGGGGAA